jgi:hypothetical protein
VTRYIDYCSIYVAYNVIDSKSRVGQWLVQTGVAIS